MRKINWPHIRTALVTVLVGTVLTAGSLNSTSDNDGGDNDRVGKGICYKALPPEAHDTIKDIAKGGPYDYPEKDGTVFDNRDSNPLPKHENGFYHEFTVRTPGIDHRGMKRIVTGGKISDKKLDYYTEDHYKTFDPIKYGC